MNAHTQAQAALLQALASNAEVAGVAPRRAAPDLPPAGPLHVDQEGLDPDVPIPTGVSVTGSDHAPRRWLRFADSGEPDMLRLLVLSGDGDVLGALVASFDDTGTLLALHGMAS